MGCPTIDDFTDVHFHRLAEIIFTVPESKERTKCLLSLLEAQGHSAKAIERENHGA